MGVICVEGNLVLGERGDNVVCIDGGVLDIGGVLVRWLVWMLVVVYVVGGILDIDEDIDEDLVVVYVVGGILDIDEDIDKDLVEGVLDIDGVCVIGFV
jgi:hypothetical protein